MNKLIIALALGAAAIGPAVAADFPYKAPAAPAVAPVQYTNWTGFYVGAQGQYGWQNFDYPDPAVGTMKANGFMGGVTVGYDYQMSNVVIGVLGDAAFGNVGVSVFNGPGGQNVTAPMTENATEKSFSTVRARLGYLVAPSLLLYGTGGVAIATVEQGESCAAGASVYSFCSASKRPSGKPFAGAYDLLGNQTYVGWTAGAGAEWMFARGWSFKTEYLYADMGNAHFDLGNSPNGTATTPRDVTLRQQQVKFGVNYKFGQ